MLVIETLTIDAIQYIESGVRTDSHGIQTISHSNFFKPEKRGSYNLLPMTKYVNFETTGKVTLIIKLVLSSEFALHPCLYL